MEGCCSQTILIVTFLFLKSALNLLNKWSLGVFPYPILLTVSHMASSTILLAPVMLWKHGAQGQIEKFSRSWKGILAIAVTIALNISLNNASMLHMTLSLNQVIRSSMPIFTSLIAFPVEGKVPKPLEMLALCVLSLGIMICVWRTDAAGTVPAMLLCLTATVCNSAMSCFTGRVLAEAMDALQLVFLTSPFCFLVLLPYLIYRELPVLLRDMQAQDADMAYQFHINLTAILGGTSLIAISYNFVHARLIKATSATTTTVIGQCKIVGLVVLSAALLGESSIFNLQMTVGTILAFTGFAGYSFLRMAAKQKALQASSDHQQSVLKAVQEIESEVQKPLLEKAEPSQDNANRV